MSCFEWTVLCPVGRNGQCGYACAGGHRQVPQIRGADHTADDGAGITPALVWLYVFMTDRISGIILLVTMPILIVFLILVGLAARKQTERRLDSYRMLSNHFVDSLRGLTTLKFLGQSRKHSESIQQVSEGYRAATMRTRAWRFCRPSHWISLRCCPWHLLQ